jgi:hypothetical protein
MQGYEIPTESRFRSSFRASRRLNLLKNGFQRQRMAAAIYLCPLKPGTLLFNCAAPAWRQQRLLAQMVA